MRAFGCILSFITKQGSLLPEKNRLSILSIPSSKLFCSKVSETNDSEQNIDDERYLSSLFNEKAPIAKLMGMTLSFEADGTSVVKLPYNEFLNQAEQVSGQVNQSRLIERMIFF